ncbi:MAG: VIT domain-containing protein, partial [Bacteroidales bacterium]
MKKIKITLIFMSMVLLIQEISSRENEDNDQTLSPYFLVLGEGNETEQLPLESTSAKVKIAGIIADVEVNQVYRNNGSKPIEAIYVFPASSKAAVYGMKMIIGERTIVAKIKEKEEARKDYEEAKTQGKGASLLEQQRPNVFQMNVANIMPGDRIEISLKYTETLVPNKNTYQFIYPAVAGPRYEGKMSTPGNWVANPYTKEGEDPHYKFNIEVTLIAGMKIQSARCNSHETTINYKGSDLAHVQLKKPWGKEGNRDFILDYRLAGDGLESGILLFEGEKENFFLAMIHPPGRIDEEIIPAREYVFIIDVSGSMHGFPLSVSKEMMRTLLSGLKPMDRFNVLLFAGNSSVLSKESLPATPQNIEYAMEHINSRSGSGGTELIHALRRAFDLKSTENYSRSFVILTDGYVTVEKEAFDLIRQNLNNANFYPFGIGTSVNRYIIEGMARVGKTEPIVVTAKEEAEKAAIAFREYIKYPVLSRIKYSFEEFDAYDTEPFTVQDVLAERPVLLFGKYKGYPRGNITITGITGKGTFKKTIPVCNSETGKNKALQYLWARERIRLLGDYARVDHDEDLKNEILELGINYNLLTDYTSFVAIDSEVRNKTGTQTT